MRAGLVLRHSPRPLAARNCFGAFSFFRVPFSLKPLLYFRSFQFRQRKHAAGFEHVARFFRSRGVHLPGCPTTPSPLRCCKVLY